MCGGDLLARTCRLCPGEVEAGETLLIYGRPSQFNVNRFSLRNVSINGRLGRHRLRRRRQVPRPASAES